MTTTPYPAGQVRQPPTDDEPRDPWVRAPRVWGEDLAEVTVDGMPVSRPPRDEDRIRRHGGNGQPAVRVVADDGTVLAASTWYQRVTRFIKVIDEDTNLQMWQERMLCRGILARHEEFLDDIALNQEDRDGLNGVIARAKEAGGRNVAAVRGKALHFMLERADLASMGLAQMPPIVPTWMAPDIAARLEQTRYFRWLHVEKPMVHDGLRVLGTPDRVFGWRPCPNCGRSLYIGDDKGLALDTPLPTPTGWTTMGEVRPGEQVLGRDGRPTTVTRKSATKRIGTYVVTFDDGATVICDSEHLWETTTGQPAVARTSIKDIETIRDTLLYNGQRDHRVAMPAALDLPEAKVPIEPYVLGVWLGDGAVRGGTVSKERDLFEVLEADGVPLGVEQVDARNSVITRTVLGLTTALREAGLLHNKHVPAAYLRGSFEQRLRLLQGLMDTDGCWNKARRTASFDTADEGLARSVEELLLTLGQRPTFSSATRRGFGLTVQAWRVEFTPVDLVPFRLPRKAGQAIASTKSLTRARRRVIVAVEPGPDVETACIAVDSPDRMYLCGRRMVPTHNTGRVDEYTELQQAMQLGIYANASYYDVDTGVRTPQDDICRCRGCIIHTPYGSGASRLQWIDIWTGWRLASELAPQVWLARRKKDTEGPLGALLVPFEPEPDLHHLLTFCTSLEDLQRMERAYRQYWTEEIAALALAKSQTF